MQPGSGSSKEEYRIWINDLVRQGYLARTGDKYPVIAPGAKSSGLLAGTSRVRLRHPCGMQHRYPGHQYLIQGR